MNKTEFVQSLDVSDNLAEEAWERANGDEDKAKKLLALDRLTVKGRFSDPEAGFYGLIFINWSADRDSLLELEGVVVGDDSVQNVDPSSSVKKFKRNLEGYTSSEAKMGGYTDQLESSLRKIWSNPNSDVRECVKSGTLDLLEGILEAFIADDLELSELSLSTDIDRKLHLETTTKKAQGSTSGASSSDTEIPCHVEINPVKGMPVSRVNPGDHVYVDPGNPQDYDKDVASTLENRREDNGLISAKLIAKGGTKSGKLRMEVDLGEGLKGKVNCGKDVSILVPESTLRSKEQGSDTFDDMMRNELILGIALGGILLLVLGIWLFLL
ncbi:MAG: hypothetical protein ABEK50_09790 [bacterium]